MTLLLRTVVFLFVGAALLVPSAEAQIWKKAKEAAKRATERTVERKVEEKTEKVVGGAIDGAASAIVCAATDQACIDEAEASGQPVVVTDDEGNVVREIPAAGGAAQGGAAAAEADEPEALAPGEGAWANYDFVPGSEVFFATDFSEDNVGDFPRRLEFIGGNMEIVEWKGQRLIRSTADGRFNIPLSEPLPERFTIELDVYIGAGHFYRNPIFTQGENEPVNINGYPASWFNLGGGSVGLAGQGPESVINEAILSRGEQMKPIRIMVDGSYAKMYVGEQRVANVPNAVILRGDKIQIGIYGDPDQPSFIGNIRVAGGGRDLYDKLEEEGRVSTQGILFDTGSAAIQPESTPTLKEIGQMLEQHADLKLRIEGHTDNVGTEATNKSLSQLRAAAVKAFLEAEYGIDASRLEAVGHGQEQPVADNATPEGRQQNRRVELVKL